MNFTLFYHSAISCWNHGNAHFLRGVCRELIALGHKVTVWEPVDGWSRTNALQDGGVAALKRAKRVVPGLQIRSYRPETLDLADAVEGADVVIVHEWNTPELVAALGALRIGGAQFTLLFHDTHHRAVSAPDEIALLDIDGYDGVLAFGEILREVYVARGWARQVFTWHEGADTALFHPIPGQKPKRDLVWIGNWGDGERSAELREFLLEPVSRLGLSARIHGVRYPDGVRTELKAQGVDYAGWLPNHHAPGAFASAAFTVHVPRKPYVEMLPGIPTIRVFEALACGIPLACAPWHDAEGLFPGDCYLTAPDGEAMTETLSRLRADADLRQELITNGLRIIEERHSCAHRVCELLQILEELGRETNIRLKTPITGDTRPEATI